MRNAERGTDCQFPDVPSVQRALSTCDKVQEFASDGIGRIPVLCNYRVSSASHRTGI